MSRSFENRSHLSDALLAIIPKIPQAQRQVALFLLENFARVPLMSATDLAQAAGTSQSSVTRFVARLGFESYHEFTKALQSILLQEIEESVPLERFTQVKGADTLLELIQAEAANIQGLAQVVASEPFERCVERLDRARRVILVGLGAARSIAVHVDLYLSRLREGVEVITESGAYSLVDLIHATPQDYVLLFVVPRHPRDVEVVAMVLHEQGVPIGLVTDRSGVVVAPFAQEILITQVLNGPTTALPSCMMLLASLLVDAVALKNPQRTRRMLSSFEEMARGTGLFPSSSRGARPYWEGSVKTEEAEGRAKPKPKRRS